MGKGGGLMYMGANAHFTPVYSDIYLCGTTDTYVEVSFLVTILCKIKAD